MSRLVLTHVFHPWHCDHFGHVNTRHYAAAFDDATFAFWAGLGVGQGSIVPVTARQMITYQTESTSGTVVSIHAKPVRVGDKSVTLEFAMSDLAGGALAHFEVVEVFFDNTTRQSAKMPENVRAALNALAEAAS
uniref:acyl-CoA thioesterase n=1 Tax=Roseovarius sp. BRH_c41 TaxID=1629709 RepID=UPI000B1D3DBF|nr:thioesterase family protein [Roseovarius sp. BRH_c41]